MVIISWQASFITHKDTLQFIEAMDNKYFFKKKVNKTTGRLQLSFNKCNPSTAFPVKIWAEKLQHKLG